ncbi:hypothetical protein [Kribbella sp. NPDC051137]|uniref:hypothetical protein n=1 Tax=Kribbella sp. NPDC051137 TaxID=3155045 RepID=UPI00341769EB
MVGFGVAVWLGFRDDRVGLGDGLGVRVVPRLGAVVDRVGVGFAPGVFDGVLLGVGVGLGVGGRDRSG